MSPQSQSSLKEQIRQSLSSVSLPSIPPDILSKLAALSTSLRLTPSQLAEAWEAHSMTKNVDQLNDVTYLGYRSALTKEAESRGVNIDSSTNNANKVVVKRTGLGKRTAPSSSASISPIPTKRGGAAGGAGAPIKLDGNAERDGLSAVDAVAHTTPGDGPVSPSAKNTTSHHPDSNGSSSTAMSVVTPPKHTLPSQAQLTPLTYRERPNPGVTLISYNPRNLPTAVQVMEESASRLSPSEREALTSKRGCTIQMHPEATHPTKGFRFMFTPLEKRASCLESRLLEMNEVLMEECGIREEETEEEEAVEEVGLESKVGENRGEKMATWAPVGVPKQNTVTCIGRICNEAHEGKINSTSLLLEGSRQHSSGSRIHLDPTLIPSYSLFPGQIVAVEGINSSGRTLQASRLIEGAAPSLDTSLASELMEFQHGSIKGMNGMPLSIVAMSGPYTTKDNLEYDPLVDAILKISEDKPDVVIMCGPFVDVRQPLVQDERGAIILNEDGEKETATFQQVFAKKVAGILQELYEANTDIKTQFVLVPSVDDAISDSVYPQPPMVDLEVKTKGAAAFGSLGLHAVEMAGRETSTGNRPKRVHCVSNPCTLRINDVTIGVTSSDVLFHISSDETNANLPPGSRLARIAEHLLHQRSYYPLFPPAKGACLDLARYKEWEMPCRPDILIVPSRLATFAKEVMGGSTIVVNPGELTKGTTGGTYAVMDVHPMEREGLEKAVREGDEEMEHGVKDRVRVDIKRI